jgi:hypothetical protein
VNGVLNAQSNEFNALGAALATGAQYTSSNSTIVIPSDSLTSSNINNMFEAFGAYATGVDSTATVCSYNSSTNIVTFTTATNSFLGTWYIVPTGFTGGCSEWNNVLLKINAAQLSTTNVPAVPQGGTFTTMSATDTGTLNQTIDILGRIATVAVGGGNFTPTTVAWGSSSVVPNITVTTGGSILYGPDNTIPLNAIMNAGCNSSNYPAGDGARVPNNFIPMDQYIVTATLNTTCGHVSGTTSGGGGTKLIWMGSNLTEDFIYKPSGTPGNNVISNITLYAGSPYFVPTWAIETDSPVDSEARWHDITAQHMGNGCFKLTAGWINLAWDNVNCRDTGGSAIYAVANNTRIPFVWSGTIDMGSAVWAAQQSLGTGLTQDHFFTFDCTAGLCQGGGPIVLTFKRYEAGIFTNFSCVSPCINPSLIFFKSGNSGGSSYYVMATTLINSDINLVNTTEANISIFGTDDLTSHACANFSYVGHNLISSTGVIKTWTTPTGQECASATNGATIPVTNWPGFADGQFDIFNWTQIDNAVTATLPAQGLPVSNLALDSYWLTDPNVWTVPTQFSVQQNCENTGRPCFQVGPGDGSTPMTLNAVTQTISNLPPLASITVDGWGDCSGVISPINGALGWHLVVSGLTTLNGTCIQGQPAGFDKPLTITLPSGVTSISLQGSTGGAKLGNGQYLRLSMPHVVIGGPAYFEDSIAPPIYVLTGTTTSIGGGALAAGACTSAVTTSVPGANVGMGVHATPSTFPGTGFWWEAYVSSSNTVTTYVCAAIAGTPAASVYNIRVNQ